MRDSVEALGDEEDADMKYRVVHEGFWQDDKLGQVSSDAILVAVYLLTSPNTKSLGCFHMPVLTIVAATTGRGINPNNDIQGFAAAYERVTKALGELSDISFISYDFTHGWVWLRKYTRYNRPHTTQQKEGINRQMGVVPSSLCFYSELLSLDQATPKRQPRVHVQARGVTSTSTRNKEERKITEHRRGGSRGGNLVPDVTDEHLPPEGGAVAQTPDGDRSVSQRFPELNRLPKQSGLRRYPVEFDRFWSTYPTGPRDTKAKGYAAWRKIAVNGPVSVEELLAAADRYRKFLLDDGGPSAHVQTWINREGWTATYAATTRSNHQPSAEILALRERIV